jgi:hypothetical protein
VNGFKNHSLQNRKEEKAMTFGKIIDILLLAIAIVGAVACGSDNGASVQNTQKFSAHLSGANVVPPVNSGISGAATLILDEQNSTIQFIAQALFDPLGDGGKSITGAHIHIGAAGVNGDVVVVLANAPGPNLSHSGTIRASDVLGISFNELVSLMRNGQLYVDVHTTDEPDGELRGQIKVVN